MDVNIEQEEIKPLTFNYFFHLILFILIFILHIIIKAKIYWISITYRNIYLFGTYLGIFYFLFPVVPMMFISFKLFKKKIIILFKRLSLYILILSILVGILNSAVILVNTLNSKTFCRECPFSISSLSHLNKNFEKYYGKIPNSDELKDLCKSRRCTLDSVNQNKEYPYIYLCNYNPAYDFDKEEEIKYTRTKPDLTEISTDKQILCTSLGVNYDTEVNFEQSVLYDYLDLCYYLTEFYYCKRFNQPEESYDMDLGSTCPESNYLFLLYILSVLVIIIDIVITMLPWGVEYVSLKRILLLLNSARRKPTSHNSTAKSSSPSNYQDSFKKERTLVIISPLNDDNIININRINNNSAVNNNIIVNNNNIQNINIRESNNPLMLINNDENGNNEELKSSDRAFVNQINSDNNGNNNNEVFVHNKNRKTNELNVSPDYRGSVLQINRNARDNIIQQNENNKNNNDKNNNNNNNN